VAKSGLTSSLFVRHPETNELFVNFDPQILTLIHETEYMGRLGLEIPELAKTLRAQQETYKELYNSMTVSFTSSIDAESHMPLDGSSCVRAYNAWFV